MSDTRELLGKLALHGVAMDAVILGSRPEMTAQMVAAAMGMGRISVLEESILLAKWCGDQVAAQKLAAMWLYDVLDLLLREGIKPQRGVMSTLAAASVDEYLDRRKCKWCHGVSQRVVDHKIQTCGLCKGTGLWQHPERHLAEWAGISKTGWRTTYAPLLELLKADLQSREDRAIAKVADCLLGKRSRRTGMREEQTC